MKPEAVASKADAAGAHYFAEIREIRKNRSELSAEAQAHIDSCPVCAREARLMEAIAGGVAAMPRAPVPAILRNLVFERLTRPAYRAWHIAVAVLFAAAAPVLFHQLIAGSASVAGNHFLIYFFFGVLNVLLIFPAAFYLFAARRRDLERWESAFHHYLETPRDVKAKSRA